MHTVDLDAGPGANPRIVLRSSQNPVLSLTDTAAGSIAMRGALGAQIWQVAIIPERVVAVLRAGEA